MGYEFSMETKLRREAPELHRIFSDNVLCCQNMLTRYQSFFPNYTDHTSLHSMEVIDFCNELIGSNIEGLNPDEIFILLMAAYLHDAGMGISLSDYEQFSAKLPMAEEYRRANPDEDTAEIIRRFHNEFSGQFIRKYAPLFDFPSEEHMFCVIQVSRGHRKTDLYDEKEYPAEFKLNNGNTVHLPYLASLIRLADELDIASDRNTLLLYDINSVKNARSILEFKKHMAIRHVSFEKDSFRAEVKVSDDELRGELREMFEKLNKTLEECVRVTRERSPFRIYQTRIEILGDSV